MVVEIYHVVQLPKVHQLAQAVDSFHYNSNLHYTNSSQTLSIHK